MSFNTATISTLTAELSAILGTALVVTGHSDLKGQASTAFVAVAGLLVTVLHSKLISAHTKVATTTASKSATA